jgi:hypothetical protein
MENSTDSPHRYDTGVKAKHWANLLVEHQGSGGLAFTITETKGGRLAGQGPGEGRTEWHAGVEGDWSGCAPSNASIIDRALWITTLPTLRLLSSCVI